MPAKKKTNKKPGRAGKIALRIAAALLILLLIVTSVGAINAVFVRVRRAEVALADLPAAFDGVTLLYASDIDLCGLNTPRRAAGLFAQLQSLKPDILVLGGDYASSSVFDRLNAGGSQTADAPENPGRAAFFQGLAGFEAPLGKYALRTEEDGSADALTAELAQAGIQPIFDSSAAVRRDGSVLYLAGFSGDPGAIARAAALADRGDCVVAVTASPTQLPQLMINEAAGGGSWCDMVLSGGTHAGQIRLGKATLLSLNGIERNYLYGWRVENGIPLLTTSGVGCEGLNVRLGTSPEVWLITLRKK